MLAGRATEQHGRAAAPGAKRAERPRGRHGRAAGDRGTEPRPHGVGVELEHVAHGPKRERPALVIAHEPPPRGRIVFRRHRIASQILEARREYR